MVVLHTQVDLLLYQVPQIRYYHRQMDWKMICCSEDIILTKTSCKVGLLRSRNLVEKPKKQCWGQDPYIFDCFIIT